MTTTYLYIFLLIQGVLKQRGFKQCDFITARLTFWYQNIRCQIEISAIPRNSAIFGSHHSIHRFKQCGFEQRDEFFGQKCTLFEDLLYYYSDTNTQNSKILSNAYGKKYFQKQNTILGWLYRNSISNTYKRRLLFMIHTWIFTRELVFFGADRPLIIYLVYQHDPLQPH